MAPPERPFDEEMLDSLAVGRLVLDAAVPRIVVVAVAVTVMADEAGGIALFESCCCTPVT